MKIQNNILLEDEKYLTITALLIIITSGFLILVFILQWTFPFTHNVHILRHLANLLFSACAIFLLYSSTMKKENLKIDEFFSGWNNTNSKISKFETQNSCSTLIGDNSCQTQLNQSFQSNYSFGRKFKPCFGLFWGAVLFYGCISILVLYLNQVVMKKLE